MPKKVVKLKKKKAVKQKQKQKQSQTQKVIINISDIKKAKPSKRTKSVKKSVNNAETQNVFPRGWNVYSTPDTRQIDELRGQLINVQNKLINPVMSANQVGRSSVGSYSLNDNIGDFSNETKFVDNKQKEQEKQQQPLYETTSGREAMIQQQEEILAKNKAKPSRIRVAKNVKLTQAEPVGFDDDDDESQFQTPIGGFKTPMKSTKFVGSVGKPETIPIAIEFDSPEGFETPMETPFADVKVASAKKPKGFYKKLEKKDLYSLALSGTKGEQTSAIKEAKSRTGIATNEEMRVEMNRFLNRKPKGFYSELSEQDLKKEYVKGTKNQQASIIREARARTGLTKKEILARFS